MYDTVGELMFKLTQVYYEYSIVCLHKLTSSYISEKVFCTTSMHALALQNAIVKLHRVPLTGLLWASL